MPTPKADLITHPARAQILMALMGRRLTTEQLAALLPDVPRASLYRHVRRLAEAGVIAAVEQIPVRGATEKVYAVQERGGALAADDVAGATPADQVRYFTTLLQSLAGRFQASVGDTAAASQGAAPTYGASPLYLSDGEYRELLGRIRALIAAAQANAPAPGRRRHVLALIAFPDQPDPPGNSAED